MKSFESDWSPRILFLEFFRVLSSIFKNVSFETILMNLRVCEYEETEFDTITLQAKGCDFAVFQILENNREISHGR